MYVHYFQRKILMFLKDGLHTHQTGKGIPFVARFERVIVFNSPPPLNPHVIVRNIVDYRLQMQRVVHVFCWRSLAPSLHVER